MAVDTHAEKMVARYEEILLECAGMSATTIDGQQVQLVDLEAKLDHWKARVARVAGTRPRCAQIDLTDFS